MFFAVSFERPYLKHSISNISCPWSIEIFVFSLVVSKAFGVKADELERYVSRGIIVWGQQVQDALDMVKDCVNEINTFEDLQLLTILLEGEQQHCFKRFIVKRTCCHPLCITLFIVLYT